MRKYFHLILILCLLIGSCKKSAVANKPTIPLYDHVVVVILENRSYQNIINSPEAPYINSLANTGASFTASFAIEHPSQPNYLDLYSGSNQGITDNVFPSTHFKTLNLGYQLIVKGKSFKTYSENLPAVGWDGDSINGYVHKHNPSANWMGTDINQIPPETNQPFSAFPSDFNQLPTVSFIIPSLQNDMHNGSILTGDTWIKNNLAGYITWAQTHNSLLILTFDEDDTSGNNHIATIFSGQYVKPGSYTTQITHFTILRTLEDMYNLGYAGQASSVIPITYFWN
jgi:hypothetical protein